MKHRKKRPKQNEQSSVSYGNHFKETNLCATEIPKGGKRNTHKNTIAEILAPNFPKLMKSIEPRSSMNSKHKKQRKLDQRTPLQGRKKILRSRLGKMTFLGEFRMTRDFLSETTQTRRQWSEAYL